MSNRTFGLNEKYRLKVGEKTVRFVSFSMQTKQFSRI